MFSGKKDKPYRSNEAIPSQEVLPEFAELDSDKDGVISKEEHLEAKEDIARMAPLTPFVVFCSMLGAIIIICLLSGIRYGEATKAMKERLRSARIRFVNLLTKWKNRDKTPTK
jgi:hypothetical protein